MRFTYGLALTMRARQLLLATESGPGEHHSPGDSVKEHLNIQAKFIGEIGGGQQAPVVGTDNTENDTMRPVVGSDLQGLKDIPDDSKDSCLKKFGTL